MSGYTKHMSVEFLNDAECDFNKHIKEITRVLPREYDLETVLNLLRKFYPYEWRGLCESCLYYHKKDKKLISIGKKQCHFIPEPEEIIMSLKSTKRILEKNFMDIHRKNFSQEVYIQNVKELEAEREPKIQKNRKKIEKAKQKAQLVEPIYLDKLIGLYDRKKTSQKDKVYIFKELEKYYCPKTVNFFMKKLDSEYNRQLREMAFYHLQSFKHICTLRKQKYMVIPSKNKKRRKYLKEVYAFEKFDIKSIPQELEYRIENAKEQKMKEYDFFISHSSSDYKEVQKMIRVLNQNRKNVYCDWIADTDYLKRNLVGDATKAVIEKRLLQSKNILLINSEHAIKSNWVKYELNYFDKLNRKIYVIDREDVLEGKTIYKLIEEKWFLDKKFEEIKLY